MDYTEFLQKYGQNGQYKASDFSNTAASDYLPQLAGQNVTLASGKTYRVEKGGNSIWGYQLVPTTGTGMAVPWDEQGVAKTGSIMPAEFGGNQQAYQTALNDTTIPRIGDAGMSSQTFQQISALNQQLVNMGPSAQNTPQALAIKNQIAQLQGGGNTQGFVGTVNGTVQTFPTQTAAQQAGATNIQQNLNYAPTNSTQSSGGFPTSNLGPGSTGSQVQALQQWLVQNGYLTQAEMNTGPGIYGPKTTAAVANWQKSVGIQAPANEYGYFGPKSIAYLQGQTGTVGTQQSGTHPAGLNDAQWNALSPTQQASMQALDDNIKKATSQGYTINPNVAIDQDTVKRFMEQAAKDVHPYYAQQIQSTIDDTVRKATEYARQYGGAVAGAESSYQQNLGGAREGYAGAGLAFSGQRGAGELGMQASQNRSLQDLGANYSNSLIDLGRNAEKQIGAGNVNYQLPNQSMYSANLAGNQGGFSQGGTTTGYTPGSFQIGSIPREEAQTAESRGQNYSELANKALKAGLSYQSLFH